MVHRSTLITPAPSVLEFNETESRFTADWYILLGPVLITSTTKLHPHFACHTGAASTGARWLGHSLLPRMVVW